MTNVVQALQDDFKLFLQALGSSLIFLRPPVLNMQSQTIFNMDLSVFKYRLSVVWERAGLLEPLFCGHFSMTLKKRS